MESETKRIKNEKELQQNIFQQQPIELHPNTTFPQKSGPNKILLINLLYIRNNMSSQ